MLFRPVVILQLQHDILRLAQIELREVELSRAHEVVLQTPVIVEDLSKRPRSFASFERKSKKVIKVSATTTRRSINEPTKISSSFLSSFFLSSHKSLRFFPYLFSNLSLEKLREMFNKADFSLSKKKGTIERKRLKGNSRFLIGVTR